jgi:hypothetical protein
VRGLDPGHIQEWYAAGAIAGRIQLVRDLTGNTYRGEARVFAAVASLGINRVPRPLDL